jgi:hypothetical protein
VARQLVHRRHNRVGRGFGACGGNAQVDKKLFDPCRAGRDEHACALRPDDVGVSDLARAEEVLACIEVDPLLADEDGDLTLEDVERLVLVVVQMQGRPGAARVVGLDL